MLFQVSQCCRTSSAKSLFRNGVVVVECTVIVPTRNRASLLRATLDSIASQSFPVSAYEVLICDNGSTDATASVAESFSNRIQNYRILTVPQPGLHQGRHAGLLGARGDFLVFCDDDIVASKTWLSSILDGFNDPNCALIGGPCRPLFEAEPPGWLNDIWSRSHEGGRLFPALSLIDLGDEARAIPTTLVFGCNFAIRKSVLERAGGFHPDGMPAEFGLLRGDGETYVSDFIARLGMVARYCPGAAVEHCVPTARMTEKYLFTRAFDQGLSDSFTWLRGKHFNQASLPSRNSHNNMIIKGFHRFLNKSFSWRKAKPIGYADVVLSACEQAREIGIKVHRKAFDRSAELRSWVLSPDFVDRPLPAGDFGVYKEDEIAIVLERVLAIKKSFPGALAEA